MLFRNDNPIKFAKNKKHSVYFSPMSMRLNLTFSQTCVTVCKFTLSVTSFSHERTIKSSNLSFAILLLENVFKIFSCWTIIHFCKLTARQLLKVYCLSQMMETVPFSNVMNCEVSCHSGIYIFAFHLFPLDNPKTPLVLLSVLRCRRSPLDVIVPVSSTIHRTIMWLFLDQVHQKKKRFNVLMLFSKCWEYSIKHSYDLLCLVPIDT